MIFRICLCAMIFHGCGGSAPDPSKGSDKIMTAEMGRKWNSYSARGKYDSLIMEVRPVFKLAMERQDTVSALYSGIVMAQSFLFINDLDSAAYYANSIADYKDHGADPLWQTIYYNVIGTYALKSELDYSKSLENYMEGYKWAEKVGSANNMIALLGNIVNIFYIQKDSIGMQYAQKAYECAFTKTADSSYMALSMILMSQMSFLCDDVKGTRRYADEAAAILFKTEAQTFYPALYLSYADACEAEADYAGAERHLLSALEYSDKSDPGTLSSVYLRYGDFARDRGRIPEAIELYSKGLDVSYRSENMEYRHLLLQKLSAVYDQIGDQESVLYYYHRLLNLSDSVSNTRKEQEFNRLLLSSQNIQHAHQIQSGELALLKANRMILLSVSMIVIIAILSVSYYTLYRRQRKAYRAFVAQHSQYMERMECQAPDNTTAEAAKEGPITNESRHKEKSEKDRTLFSRAESLMMTDKIYRQNDIGQEKVAEMLGTNRTYLSQAINTFANMSFNQWINMYRIAEAVKRLSDPEDDVTLKQLADDLGYNSLSAFYRAFSRATGRTPNSYR